MNENSAPTEVEVETNQNINMNDKNAVFHQIVANAQ